MFIHSRCSSISIEFFSGSTKYLSPTIQNELIQILGQELRSNLIQDINDSPFFAILIDTTQDITKVDQMSLVIRYVQQEKNENGQITGFKIEETFLGFFKVSNHSAEALTEFVLNTLKENQIDIKKCVGQGYDGASVMSGMYGGVQKRIKDVQPNAHYVHCASHNLNLVLNDAMNGCTEIKKFFTTLQNLYSFFATSVNRWDILSSWTHESEVVLKRLNPTRWAGRVNSLSAVILRYPDIYKSLTDIILKSAKNDEREEAKQIKKSIDNFEFVLLCVFLHKILLEVNFASKILQSKNFELSSAVNALQRVKNKIKNLRVEYDSIKEEAMELAAKWKIKQEFEHKRQVKIKKYFDELSTDHQFNSREEKFKTTVYYYTIDLACQQLDQRFEGMYAIKQNFNILEPKIILEKSKEDLISSCMHLINTYSDLISQNFTDQFINLVYLLKDDLNDETSIVDFLKILITKYRVLQSDFIEVYTIFFLFLTLPVTTASSERSFNKLKIIKNYLRNSTGQERLSNLAILAIERQKASKINIQKLVNTFSIIKARKVQF